MGHEALHGLVEISFCQYLVLRRRASRKSITCRLSLDSLFNNGSSCSRYPCAGGLGAHSMGNFVDCAAGRDLAGVPMNITRL
jgi:hypothetical protein